jgi:hypothetical protein
MVDHHSSHPAFLAFRERIHKGLRQTGIPEEQRL